jgi:hypothetical protein
MKKYKSGFTGEQRKAIRADLTRFTKERASRLGCPPEAVVQEIRYWQQSHPDWATNPTKTQKELSFRRYKGICQARGCRHKISSIDDATFHHKKRGVPNLHRPENMVPLLQRGCHEKLHNARPGSFTAEESTP